MDHILIKACVSEKVNEMILIKALTLWKTAVSHNIYAAVFLAGSQYLWSVCTVHFTTS